MRTALCLACFSFIVAERRGLLEAARDHVLDDPDRHPMRTLEVLDVDATARRLIGEALGAKARR